MHRYYSIVISCISNVYDICITCHMYVNILWAGLHFSALQVSVKNHNAKELA